MKIDWSKIAQHYRWIATDKDGSVWVSEQEPFMGDDDWCAPGGKSKCLVSGHRAITFSGWKNSKKARP